MKIKYSIVISFHSNCGQSGNFNHFGVTIKDLSSLFGACIVSNDGIGVIGLIHSIWLVYKISTTFIFWHTKVVVLSMEE